VITPSGLENMFAEIAAYLAALTGPQDDLAFTFRSLWRPRLR
jgi:hypothetical protein